MSLPDSQFLSAPLWLITTLHVLTLAMHFAAMNVLVGGIVIVAFGRFQNRWNVPVVGKLVQLFPSAMAITITLGVAPLLFLQLVYPRQFYSSAIVMGWFWFFVIPAVIMSYCFLYTASFGKRTPGSRKMAYLCVALFGLLYVSLLYASVFSMAEQPELTERLYGQNQSGWAWNPALGNYFFRWLHMILGALAVGGFFAGLLGKEDPQAFKVGKGFFVWGMILASLAGLTYLFSLADYMAAFMRSPAIWVLTAGVLLSAGSLHFFFSKRFLFSGAMLFASLIAMVFSRHHVRTIALESYFKASLWRVEPRWPPFIMFLACFVLALGVLLYLLRLFFGESKTSGSGPERLSQ